MGPINPTPSKSQDVQSNDNSVSQVDFKKLYDIVVGLKETMAGSKQTLSKKPGQPEDGYDYDPIEDLRLQFEQLGVNQAMARQKKVKQKSGESKTRGSTPSNKSSSGRKSKTRKTKQGEKITSSDKGRNSGANLMENLKANIKNSSNIVAPIQKQSFKSPNQPDFRNY
ncbi:2722_t:CDS:2 [Entrophospora sp. SA101]|nr:11857_t:CDS:2 [Entrophospora sp. SA101]CAJ0908269.1 2722_t:CDS:2 [Entrophospora sp. SA101]